MGSGFVNSGDHQPMANYSPIQSIRGRRVEEQSSEKEEFNCLAIVIIRLEVGGIGNFYFLVSLLSHSPVHYHLEWLVSNGLLPN